jgi:hypothetical protein
MPEDCEEEGRRGTGAIEKPGLLIEFRLSRSTAQVCIANTMNLRESEDVRLWSKADAHSIGGRALKSRAEKLVERMRCSARCKTSRTSTPEERVHRQFGFCFRRRIPARAWVFKLLQLEARSRSDVVGL